MGAIPKKALRERSFSGAERVGDGSHETWRVAFIEDGGLRSGFFKKLAPAGNFPELLAKLSVATSVILGLFQNRSAKERLVFDDDDNLVGILSLGVKDFKSFNFSHEVIPSNSLEKEKVIPSSETLILKNMMELLFGRWFLADDDSHPHNMSLEGDIDFDMFWYWFVIYMKGARPGIEPPKTRVNLTVQDYERFPCIEDGSPYHWPTFTHPGEGRIAEVLPGSVQRPILSSLLPKVYADPTQFVRLAGNKKAQEQKVAAALKILLTFQPETLRHRLSDFFGNLSLNYTSLNPILREKYEREFPSLCDSVTDKLSFVDFMMKLYQQHYDNLYRVVVFYAGCEDNGFGSRLLATDEALYTKPSFFRNIEAWISEENGTTYAGEPENKYSLEELKKRYHQVWRDAFAPKLKALHRTLRKLTGDIGALATTSEEVAPLLATETMDLSVTSSLQWFGLMTDVTVDAEIRVSIESDAYQALQLLIRFTNQFQHLLKAYYEKERHVLSEEDNLIFASGLSTLCEDYNLHIRRSLAFTTSHANKFAAIVTALRQFAGQVNFKIHLLTTDEQMQDTLLSVKKELPPLTDPDVLAQFNEALFGWAAGLPPLDFNRYINEVIDTKYAPTIAVLSTRQRAQPVKDYLTKSTESNRNKLAYILSSGACEDGALNRFIFQELTPIMLATNYVASVDLAIKAGRFEEHIGIFARSIVNFSKESKEFTHLCSARGINLFYQALYRWVEDVPKERLDHIINAALGKYESGLSIAGALARWTFLGNSASSSRKSEIKKYFRDESSKARALALTFMRGELTSTASAYLFIDIVTEIKRDISTLPALKEDPGYKLVDLFNETENKEFYLAHMKNVTTLEMSRTPRVAEAVPA